MFLPNAQNTPHPNSDPKTPIITHEQPAKQSMIIDKQRNHKQRKDTSNNYMKIMYANIQGFKSKTAGLTEILHDNKPHLFLLTETQLRCDTSEKIDGFTFYSRARKGKTKGGGVGILVRNDMCIYTSPHYSDRNIEVIWVFIRRKAQPPLIIGTYYGKQETTNKNDIEHEMQLFRHK